MRTKHNTNSLPKVSKVIYIDDNGNIIKQFPVEGVDIIIKDDGKTLVIKEKG